MGFFFFFLWGLNRILISLNHIWSFDHLHSRTAWQYINSSIAGSEDCLQAGCSYSYTVAGDCIKTTEVFVSWSKLAQPWIRNHILDYSWERFGNWVWEPELFIPTKGREGNMQLGWISDDKNSDGTARKQGITCSSSESQVCPLTPVSDHLPPQDPRSRDPALCSAEHGAEVHIQNMLLEMLLAPHNRHHCIFPGAICWYFIYFFCTQP